MNGPDRNLIISHEPIEPIEVINDIQSQSLSEGYITLETLKKFDVKISPRLYSSRSQSNGETQLITNAVNIKTTEE